MEAWLIHKIPILVLHSVTYILVILKQTNNFLINIVNSHKIVRFLFLIGFTFKYLALNRYFLKILTRTARAALREHN